VALIPITQILVNSWWRGLFIWGITKQRTDADSTLENPRMLKPKLNQGGSPTKRDLIPRRPNSRPRPVVGAKPTPTRDARVEARNHCEIETDSKPRRETFRQVAMRLQRGEAETSTASESSHALAAKKMSQKRKRGQQQG